jgi:cytidylate kinase
VAARLGFCYVDSGAVYRAIAWALREGGIGDAADPRVVEAVPTLPLSIRPDPDRFRVFLGERELSGELRTPEISSLASKLAVVSSVRARVRELLREAGSRGRLVVEGRDIGTVVFPEAVLKVFLQADLPVRALRRQGDLRRQGIEFEADRVERDLAERDRRDSTRRDSPLRVPEGAVLIDTSRCDVDGQVEAILAAYQRALQAAGLEDDSRGLDRR